jgi:hypothetical protein
LIIGALPTVISDVAVEVCLAESVTVRVIGTGPFAAPAVKVTGGIVVDAVVTGSEPAAFEHVEVFAVLAPEMVVASDPDGAHQA